MISRRYPRYKDSGVNWLGEIPEHWQIKRLKHVCDAFPSNVDKHSYPDETPVRLCNYTDVYYNDEIVADMELMQATASEEQIARFTLRADDVIITKDSETPDDIAVSTFVPRPLPGVVCGYHLAIVRPHRGISGEFIKRFFDSNYARSSYQVLANGLTRYALGQYEINNVELPVPPLEEQRDIAKFLKSETVKIDSLIAEQACVIRLLSEKRDAVASHTVIRGLNPDAKMRKSPFPWLSEVPSHWNLAPFKSLFRRVKRTGNSDEPLLSVYRDFGVLPREGRTDNNNRASEDLNLYQLVLPGDLAVNKMKAWQGSVAVSNHRGIVSPAYFVYRPTHSENPSYLHYLLRSKAYICGYKSLSKGIRVNQWDLDPILHGQMPVLIPPIEEQKAIVDLIIARTEITESLLRKAQEAIRLLKERRVRLISAAITGQIDVRSRVEVHA